MAGDCIFCGIAAGEIPAQRVAEGETWVAFRDTDPKAPTHVLLIPREHVASLSALHEAHESTVGAIILAAAKIAAAEGIAAGGYRLVANAGRDAGQSVDHIHFHLLGGRRMSWPPG